MTSSRLPADLRANTLEEARRSVGEYIDLTVSNPTRCGLPYAQDTIRQALSEPSVLTYEADAAGAWSARSAVARWLGHGVTAETIVLTASTSEAYGWLFKLLGDPGDDVLTPAPSYPLFEWLARLEGLRARPVPSYFVHRWHLDLEALASAIQERTRAVLVVNPNNPTGHFLSRAEWDALTTLCAQRGLALIVDEVFADYPLEAPPDHLPTVLASPAPPCPVFVLSGLSKVAALPQVKLGWIVAHGSSAEALLEPLHFLADQYLSVSASAQAAASALLEEAPAMQRAIGDRVKANLQALDEALVSHPQLSRLPVEGGWSVLLRRPALESDELCALRLLQQAGVLVQPGQAFDLPPGHLVLSLLPPEWLFRLGLERMLHWVSVPQA
ncbi:MAG: pyridoxal phosphate-dependent aminotransferase [Firmicutes bacterium]|nr:pyridoxal phosphate-dependent aminotransferase [Bacillota bacterium]